MDNLLYAAPNKTKTDIEKVLRALSLGDLDIERKPNTLSGGQRLRVALARALLKDSEIIILDEPTSALDSESEFMVLQLMEVLKQRGKAVILISHRKSTIKKADQFLLISDQRLYQYNAFEDAMEIYEKLFGSESREVNKPMVSQP